MNPIKFAIEKPIAVISAVLLIVILGWVSLQRIPIQLTPDLRRPVLNISTVWFGAAPEEIEREIVNRQEDQFKGIDGLTELTSRSDPGFATVNLEFRAGHDMTKALIDVTNRLSAVTGYPDEVDEPRVRTGGQNDNNILWMYVRAPDGSDVNPAVYTRFVEDVVIDRLERVPGVARINFNGGVEDELKVIVDPERLAQYGLTIPGVLNALRGANASISAGEVDEGKRAYTVRTDNELQTIDQVRDVVLISSADALTGRIGRVTVGDVADVEFGMKKQRNLARQLGRNALALGVIADQGANVIETVAGIREVVGELERGPVGDLGLEMRITFDATDYINSAISLVQMNIMLGGVLAVLVLLVFLRSWRAILVIGVSIPVSVIGSFVAMSLLGLSINVISLAGIAFAVGMVVDAAIVVLENIYRRRQEGLTRADAAYYGAEQVWKAVLVSALTTIAVFAPIIMMDLEAGQLFRDIAVAISVSVALSLVVSATVIPALASRLLRSRAAGGESRFHVPFAEQFASAFLRALMAFTDRVIRSPRQSGMMVASVVAVAVLGSWALLPKLDYLPDGNQNSISGFISFPPGYNIGTTRETIINIENRVRQYWASETGPEEAPDGTPKIDNFFAVASPSFSLIGSWTVEIDRVRELIPVLQGALNEQPGARGFFGQNSLFARGVGGARAINVNVSGQADLEDIFAVANRAFQKINVALPRQDGHQVRPIPGLELGAPELRILPNSVNLADNGLTPRDLALSVDAFNDGLRVAEITVGGRRMDLTLKGPEDAAGTTQDISNLPVVTRSGTIVPVSSLADVQLTAGPTQIRHLERERAVTLQIRPAPDLPLEIAIERVQTEVIDALRAEGLPPNINFSVTGSADQLTETWNALVVDLVLSILIVYLIMAVLFGSFLYPLVIMLSVPMATFGGVAGLGLLNLFTFQALDMLTLLGFIILVGIVVNNAILLVHQSLYGVRTLGLGIHDAILEATRNRVRPIFMSTLTSVFGMLPLVLFPGAGSELYRGLGSVVVGGLALSAVLTLAIIPPMMALTMPLFEGKVRKEDTKVGDGKPVPQPAE